MDATAQANPADGPFLTQPRIDRVGIRFKSKIEQINLGRVEGCGDTSILSQCAKDTLVVY